MKKFLALACSMLLLTASVFAQENDDSDDNDDRYSVVYSLNEPGDQFINIGLMVTMPMNFGGNFPLYRDGQLSTGGAGVLGYHRFLTSTFALGMDVSFGYNPTIGENMFTYVPFTFFFTYQPTYGHWEFPVSMGVGAAVETYLNRKYFPGLVLKPQAGVFYRATPSWSFGIKGDYMYMPQWYDDSKYNDYGIFTSVVLSARYHF